MELVEQNGDVLGWNATSIVCHAYGYVTIRFVCRYDNTPAIWRVLNGILNDIRKDTSQCFRISSYKRDRRWRFNSEIMTSLLSRTGFRLDDRPDQFFDGHPSLSPAED